VSTRDVISVFSRGGQNFDRVPRTGGAKYEEEKYFVGKNTKSHYFFNSGEQMPPLPPQMTTLVSTNYTTP